MSGKWYAINTKPRQENVALENLERQGFTAFLPMIKVKKRQRGKWTDKIEPLFPRYLFIQLTMFEDNFAPIRSTFGVHKIIRFGEYPAQVPTDLVQALIANQDNLLGIQKPKIPVFNKGDKVTVINGPLKGLTGIVENDSGEERVIMMLNLLGRENVLSVETDNLVPATA
jgi:transcriptional antiterminator RfaH